MREGFSIFMEHRTSIFCLVVCFFCKDFGNRVLPNSIWKGWLVKTPFSSLQVFVFTFSTSATVRTYFLRALSLQDWSGISPMTFAQTVFHWIWATISEIKRKNGMHVSSMEQRIHWNLCITLGVLCILGALLKEHHYYYFFKLDFFTRFFFWIKPSPHKYHACLPYLCFVPSVTCSSNCIFLIFLFSFEIYFSFDELFLA